MDSLSHNKRQANDFLASVIRSAPYGILAITPQGHITIANEQATRLLSIQEPLVELPKIAIQKCIAHIPELSQCLRHSLQSNFAPFNLELFSFEDKYLNIRGRSILKGYIITIEDITPIKEMEMLALNSVLEGQEVERRRIAKDIHDGLGPTLSTIRLMLESMRSDPCFANSQRLNSQMEETLELIDSVTDDARSISHQLMPKVLLDFGLGPALENLCNRINRSEKIQVKFFQTLENSRFDSLIELGLYRICQELLNNSVKHARASEVQVQLVEHAHSIVLMVADNGIGFDKQSVMAENLGLGLINIESRTNALGGNFIIDTSSNFGVEATIEIPLEK
ncbi:MAG: ATP-binding protein [Marinifilaceae bacterium]